METGEILKGSIESILSKWEERVREALPSTDGQNRRTLRDHLPHFLNSLSAQLQIPSKGPSASSQVGISQVHGETRAELEDYELSDVLVEYSLLRDCVLEALRNKGGLSDDVRLTVHKSIDMAMAAAGQQFADRRKNELERSLQEMRELTSELDRFVEVAAHDLRSPIATMVGFLDLALEDKDEGREHVLRSKKIALNSLDLLNSLLIRARHRHFIGSKVTFSLRDCLHSALENLKRDLETCGARVQIRGEAHLHGDDAALRQMFQNLISNCIKFRSGNPLAVEIAVEVNDGITRITIDDNGIGINEGEEETIFQAFRANEQKTGAFGLGLGLDTCRRIAELHGGSIQAQRRTSGGTRFEILLPYAEIRSCADAKTPTLSH